MSKESYISARKDTYVQEKFNMCSFICSREFTIYVQRKVHKYKEIYICERKVIYVHGNVYMF
jgi:hypothetical protein